MIKFRRYDNAAELAPILGTCPRCSETATTGTIWLDGRCLLTCDSEQCVAAAVTMLEAGGGV